VSVKVLSRATVTTVKSVIFKLTWELFRLNRALLSLNIVPFCGNWHTCTKHILFPLVTDPMLVCILTNDHISFFFSTSIFIKYNLHFLTKLFFFSDSFKEENWNVNYWQCLSLGDKSKVIFFVFKQGYLHPSPLQTQGQYVGAEFLELHFPGQFKFPTHPPSLSYTVSHKSEILKNLSTSLSVQKLAIS